MCKVLAIIYIFLLNFYNHCITTTLLETVEYLVRDFSRINCEGSLYEGNSSECFS